MATGSIVKRCNCRDETGKIIGARCPKLRRAGGTFSPTHGAWAYQLELPPATPGGPRRTWRRTSFDTRDAAAAELGDATALLALADGDPAISAQIGTLLKSLKAGQGLPAIDTVARRVRAGVPAATDITVGQYLLDWHQGRKIEETTLTSYESHIRVHLIPHLGHLPLSGMRDAHIQAMFEAITDRATAVQLARDSDDPEIRATVKGIRPTGAATMQRIRATLRKALNDAIRTHRLLEFNPATHIELPSGKRPKARVWTEAAVRRWKTDRTQPSPVMVWTPAQAGQFLDYAQAHDALLYPIYVLILHRGLRRGEAVGLPEDCVDLAARKVVIRQQITTIGYRAVTKKVKSDAGDRTVGLDATTTSVLKSYDVRRRGWRLQGGPHWNLRHGLFFVQPNGKPWHPELVSERFAKLIDGAGMPPIRLHDLRHCAASYLKAAGADLKDIQETLGHASLFITSDTYTSVFGELDVEVAKAEAAVQLIPRTKRKAS